MNQSTENKKNKGNQIISIGFFLLIIVGLYFIIDNNRDKLIEYREVLANLDFWLIGWSFVIAGVSIFARAWRWYYLVLPIKRDLSLLNAFGVSVNALAANFSMPGKLGVPVKAYLLKRVENVDMSKSLPSIFGEIFVEHSSELFIAIVSVFIGGHLTKLIYAGKQLLKNNILINIAILVALFLLLFLGIVLLRKKMQSSSLLNKFIESIRVTGKRIDYLGYSYLITTINLVISCYGFYLVIAALGHPEIDLTFVIMAGAITNFVGLISPFPGGLGARELTIYGLYDFYYQLGGIAFLAIIIMRIITYVALFLCFLIARLLTGIKGRRIKFSIQNAEELNSGN